MKASIIVEIISKDKPRNKKGIRKSHISVMLNKRDLKSLRSKLPPKSYQKIASKTGLSTSMIGKVMRDPKHFNQTVIEKALEVIKEHNTEQLVLKSKIKQVTS